MTTAETAARLSKGFGTVTTDAGVTRVIITAPDDSADEETLRAMVYAADRAGLGDDFQYEAVRDALQFVADTEPARLDDGDAAHEFADGATDVYNNALIQWLAAAPLSHMQLCDEAAEELGVTAGSGIIERISLGQYEGYRRAFAAVAENMPDDEDDTDEDDTEA